MKARKHEPQAERYLRTSRDRRFQSYRKDNYNPPGRRGPNSGRRLASGSLSTRHWQQPTSSSLNPDGGDRGVTGDGQQAGARSGNSGQRTDGGQWQYHQGWSVRGQYGPPTRDHWQFTGGRSQGRGRSNEDHSQSFRGQRFLQGQKQFRVKRRSLRGQGQGARVRGQVWSGWGQLPKFRTCISHAVFDKQNQHSHSLFGQSDGLNRKSSSSSSSLDNSDKSTSKRVNIPSTDQLSSEAADAIVDLTTNREPLQQTSRQPDSSEAQTSKSGCRRKGKASRWDVPPTETLPVIPATAEESEIIQSEDPIGERLLCLSRSYNCQEPQCAISLITEKLKTHRDAVPQPSADTSVILTPVPTAGLADLTPSNPQVTESVTKKAYATFRRCLQSKRKKNKELGFSSAGNNSTSTAQEQEATGRVTEVYSNNDNGTSMDIQLMIQPPGLQKTHSSQLSTSHKSQLCHTLVAQKTLLSESYHLASQKPEVSESQDTVKDESCSTAAANIDIELEGVKETASQKEKRVCVDLGQIHQPQTPEKSTKQILAESVSKVKTPDKTVECEPVLSVPTVDPVPGRRIVKIKPKPLAVDRRTVKILLPSTLSGSDTSDRRLIKVKSGWESFRPILTCNSSEDFESENCSVSQVKDDQHIKCASEENSSNKETDTEPHVLATSSDTVNEQTQAREFDFSSLFPHSRKAEQCIIDSLAQKCSEICLVTSVFPSVHPDTFTQHRDCESKTTQVDPTSPQNTPRWLRNCDSNVEAELLQFQDIDDDQQVISNCELFSAHGREDASQGSEYLGTEKIYIENIDEGYEGLLPSEECKSDNDKKSGREEFEWAIEKNSESEITRETPILSGDMLKNNNQKGTPRQTGVSVPLVRKVRKSSITNMNERDKLKALFSVRRRGGLKSTSKVDSTAISQDRHSEDENRPLQTVSSVDVAPADVAPAVQNTTDPRQKATDTPVCSSTSQRYSSSEMSVQSSKSVSTKQDRTVNSDVKVLVSPAELAAEYQGSELCGDTTDHADCESTGAEEPVKSCHHVKTQQPSYSHRERCVSSDCSDSASQNDQTDIIIDDDEILREIDSCLENHKPLCDNTKSNFTAAQYVDDLKMKKAIEVSSVPGQSAETNIISQNSASISLHSTSVKQTGTCQQAVEMQDKKTVNKKKQNGKSLFPTLDESIALTAGVSGLTVTDSHQTNATEVDGSLHSVFKPTISSVVNTNSEESLLVQGHPYGPDELIPVKCSGQFRSSEEKVEIDESVRHVPQIVSSISSQHVATDSIDSVKPCVRLEQDPSGITDVSIVMAITANHSRDLQSSVDSSVLQTDRSVVAADMFIEPCELAETNTQHEDDFVTTSFSLSVPKNKPLEICIEPVENSEGQLDNRDIEIEVTADTGNSTEGVKLAKMLAIDLAKLHGEGQPSSQHCDINMDQEKHSRAPLPQTADSSESKMDKGTFENASEKTGLKVSLKPCHTAIVTEIESAMHTEHSGETDTKMNSAPENTGGETSAAVDFETESVPADMETQSAASTSELELMTAVKEMEPCTAVDTQTKSAEMCVAEDIQQSEEETMEDKRNSTTIEDKRIYTSTTLATASEPFSEDRVKDNDASTEICDNIAEETSIEFQVLPSVTCEGETEELELISAEENESLRKNCSSPDLLAASDANTHVRNSHSATDNMTKLDDYSSNDDENKSPVSDDSDDLLSDGPDFLSSVVGGSVPLSAVNTNVSVHAGQSLATSQAQYPSTKFSLDSLLRDTKRDEAEEQETLAMQAQLRRELLSKEPYTQEDSDSEEVEFEGFTDEQKHTLKKLRLEEEEIQDCAPGEHVLHDHLWGRLFTESLSPAACGVKFNNTQSCLRQLFEHYQPGTLMDILSSDIIALTYHSLPCKSQIQRWLFFIMSVHSGMIEVEKCADQLLQVLQWQVSDMQQKHTWMPPIMDLFRIFVNWGANLKDLVFDTSTVDLQNFEDILPLDSSPPPRQGPPAICHRNLEPVLKLLSSWLQARPGYSAKELNQLLLMLCQLSLDNCLCKVQQLYEVQVCLASILESYQPSEWKDAVPWLCRKLSGLSTHHHNQVYITQLFSSCRPRCYYLQQRLAYLLLHSTLTTHTLSDTQIHQFQLVNLLVLIPELRHVLQSDNYHVASLIHMIDLCVGHTAQHISQRKQLFRLLEAVRLIVSEIRDSMQRLDCTKVKGMLLHLCLKWDLALKANNIKQRKIFSCFSTKARVQVEQLEDQALTGIDEDHSVDDSSTSFSDDNSSDEEMSATGSKRFKRDGSCEDDSAISQHSCDGDRMPRVGGDRSIKFSENSSSGCARQGGRAGIFETLKAGIAGRTNSGESMSCDGGDAIDRDKSQVADDVTPAKVPRTDRSGLTNRAGLFDAVRSGLVGGHASTASCSRDRSNVQRNRISDRNRSLGSDTWNANIDNTDILNDDNSLPEL